MDTLPASPHLAFDLLETDLDDPVSITALLARHAIAPARALFGFQTPTPGEHRAKLMLGGTWATEVGSGRPTWHADPSAAILTPLLRGFVLLGGVFPGGLDARGPDDLFVSLPGFALPARAMNLALLYWDEIVWVTARALGRPIDRPDDPAPLLTGGPEPSRAGIDELARAQDLVERALLPPDDDKIFARTEAGLQAIAVEVADEIDEILLADARVRLVRVSDIEARFADGPPVHPDAHDAYEELLIERGVFALTLPETIAGLVALDFVEALGVGRRTGICALCRRPFLLESQQASLARRGQAVYHPGCFRERRKRYMRDYRAGRLRSRGAETRA